MAFSLSLRVAAAVLAGMAVSVSAVAPKRGVVADGCTGSSCNDGKLLNNLGWYYAYNVEDPWYGSNVPDESAKFAPMHWCIDTLNATVPSYVNTTFMLGFNEPNNVHNCNKDANTVAKAWGQVMAQWPNSQLVSPATAGNGIPWLDQFFAACKSLYGSNGCNISYVAVHDYSCDSGTTLTYLQQVYARYKLPVWLTEFSCGDGSQHRPTKDHLAYMKDVVPKLDAAPFVYRYAWMSARDKSGLRGLVEPGSNGQDQLTELGQTYNSL